LRKKIIKMKSKVFISIFTIFVILIVSSCKKENSIKDEVEKPKEDKSFNVTMNLVVPKDDNFQIYYNEDGSDIYAPENYVDVQVKGSSIAQDIVFKLPEDVLPTSFRFDLGSNKEQGEVKINDFRMKYFEKEFVAKDTLFIYYFGYNEQIDYNRKKAIAKPKILSNKVYDPIFIGSEMLKTEIKKIVR
jgi:hypothetical protein